jgi:putative chitinase
MTRPAPVRQLDLGVVARIAGAPIDALNTKSALAGLESYGYQKLGLNRPHRMAHYLSQLMHESARFRYDREIWGPTPAQKRYDTRTDLGNTAALDGDGKKYAGRTAVQVTGKGNYAEFATWCRARFPSVPDFVKAPELINTDPWEGIAPLWYWETRALNAFADAGDVTAITRKINGGFNGLLDRQSLYAATALVLLGYGPKDTIRFQMDTDITADGVAGPKTRAALHRALLLAPLLDGGGINPPVPMTVVTLPPTAKYGIMGVVGAAIASLFSWYMGG